MNKFESLEALRAQLDEHFPGWDYWGDLMKVAERSATTRLVPQAIHLRPGATVSGPALFTMADTCMYYAILWELGSVAAPCVTADMHSRFLRRPAGDRPIVCDARLIRIGKTLIIAEATITPEGDSEPVALFTASYSAPRPASN